MARKSFLNQNIPIISATKNTLKISNKNSVNRKSIIIFSRLDMSDFVHMKWLDLQIVKKRKTPDNCELSGVFSLVFLTIQEIRNSILLKHQLSSVDCNKEQRVEMLCRCYPYSCYTQVLKSILDYYPVQYQHLEPLHHCHCSQAV